MSKPNNFPNNFELVQLSPVLIYKDIVNGTYHWFNNPNELSEPFKTLALAVRDYWQNEGIKG